MDLITGKIKSWKTLSCSEYYTKRYLGWDIKVRISFQDIRRGSELKAKIFALLSLHRCNLVRSVFPPNEQHCKLCNCTWDPSIPKYHIGSKPRDHIVQFFNLQMSKMRFRKVLMSFDFFKKNSWNFCLNELQTLTSSLYVRRNWYPENLKWIGSDKPGSRPGTLTLVFLKHWSTHRLTRQE